MSTFPNSDTSNSRTSATAGNNEQVGTEGIVPTVLSYVGLNPSRSHDEQSHATDDRGVVAGMGAGAAAATGAAGMAIQQGHGPAAAAAGSIAAAGATGAAVYGGSRAGANDATAEPAFGASVNPSTSGGAYGATDSEKAKEVAARATGSAAGYGHNEGSKSDYGLDGDAGVRDGRVRDTTGVGAVGAGSAAAAGSSIGGSQAGNERFDSTSGNATGNDRFGSSSGLSAGPNPEGARDPTQAGMEGTTDRLADRKTSRAEEGASSGANPSESQKTAENSQPKSGAGTGKLENKDSIPVAGGIKLGEKHWGESGIVPDMPRSTEEDNNVSSAEGQPDQSTRDNTAANAGHSGSEEHKEGFVDKVKDKLHMGHHE